MIFSELKNKIIPSYKFLKFVNQATIKWVFSPTLNLDKLETNIIVRHVQRNQHHRATCSTKPTSSCDMFNEITPSYDMFNETKIIVRHVQQNHIIVRHVQRNQHHRATCSTKPTSSCDMFNVITLSCDMFNEINIIVRHVQQNHTIVRHVQRNQHHRATCSTKSHHRTTCSTK